jgi:hypothetical protein
MGRKFSPLLFLSSLGAGGTAIAIWAFVNYSIPHGKGLVKISQVYTDSMPLWKELLYRFFDVNMILFALIHVVLTLVFLKMLLSWIKTEGYKEFINNPLVNGGVMAPFISITMTMNIVLGVVRYFVPAMSDNLQAMMMPGLIGWGILWLFLMKMEIRLLKISFTKGFDINKIHFGWLLHPFALGMLTVTGMGIAALSTDMVIASTAAFMSLISGTMGAFLLVVKTIAIFKSHFAAEGLPDKQFLPSFLIVVPNITLYAISLFRFGHYLEHHQGAHLVSYFTVVMIIAFAFETWYMLFGLSLLKDYFKKYFKEEFHVSQWGLVCPFVAYSVLGTFVYFLFATNVIMFWFVVLSIVITMVLFFKLLIRQLKCFGVIKNRNNIRCE